MQSLASSPVVAPRRQKDEADISTVFTSLRPDDPKNVFPPRFSELKRAMWNDGLVESWKEILEELEVATERIAQRGEAVTNCATGSAFRVAYRKSRMIPRLTMESILNGLSSEEISNIRAAGCIIIVQGAVPKEVNEAIAWKRNIEKYVAAHPGKVKGFPADNIQVFELYNTVSQMHARTHPGVLETQRSLLSLWHDESGKFALGPHVDAGSIERWEDDAYRKCFSKILEGGSAWKQHDPYDAAPRPDSDAKQDLYHGATEFPGSGVRTGQELNDATHSHLRLNKTMISMPHVEPGDQVYWHCDLIHAIETYHGGKIDSSVMYIPAAPLTLLNAECLRDQRSNFLAVDLNASRHAISDFPGGQGEKEFVGRATVADVHPDGRRALGFEIFALPGDGNRLFVEADRILTIAAAA
ncbi:hypothetical protein B0H17DRAFT_1196577 [Mycena rosella]|uniref:DUF1479-domain-containing protein n=1 Tax=Mycena rosella TaxID=1033263 RepID=A0AAD7DVL1_MYCRO|nr:hypothetical protein B0H17DRAFT_1196577 [Mycena rosella]